MPLTRVRRLRPTCTHARYLQYYCYARREITVTVIPYESDSVRIHASSQPSHDDRTKVALT